ncbi:di-trans,poly-cis-decaprenylcistransferase [Candidatus Pacearchaeota archaeon]|nr:di-trans,poly-cis-decaprenylcistransferase [Candidatus Pacearchaeota archaeon]
MDNTIPIHVAVIPDGNRRWAKRRLLKPWEGHEKAGTYENMNSLIQEAKKFGVKYMSFWGFSTENWKREKKEVDILMRIILKGLNEFDEKRDMGIRFVHVGRKDRLLKKLVDKIVELEEKTKNNKGICVIMCLDYGGRDETVRAVNKILKEGRKEIDAEEFRLYLDTNGFPDPDLIIRTGEEIRMSGFMPFQSDYAELYFTETYFPDFDVKELRKAFEEYSRRQRRYGE